MRCVSWWNRLDTTPEFRVDRRPTVYSALIGDLPDIAVGIEETGRSDTPGSIHRAVKQLNSSPDQLPIASTSSTVRVNTTRDPAVRGAKPQVMRVRELQTQRAG